MRLALSFFLLPFFLLSFCNHKRTHSLFPTHFFNQVYYSSYFSYLTPSRSLAIYSVLLHTSSLIFNFSPSFFTHEQEKHQSTFFTMFAKTALLCALFAASAQVVVAQAVVEPACFMKVFSYESYFNVKFAV